MTQERRDKAEETGNEEGSQDITHPVSLAKPETEDPEKLVRQTYILKRGQVSRVAQIAYDQRVTLNDLARFLMEYALQQVESGQLQIPTEYGIRKIVWPDD